MNWIPMRCNLATDPKTLRVAGAIGLPVYQTCGLLFAAWTLADQHGEGENARIEATPESIDASVQHKGFSLALVAVGWMTVGDGWVEFPKYLDHNGSTTKSRLLANRRQARWRKKKASTSSTQVDAMRYESDATPSTSASLARLPEKRIEEKSVVAAQQDRANGRKRKKAEPKEPEEHSAHHQFKVWYVAEWERRGGGKYPFQSSDAGAIKNILAAMCGDLDRAKQLATAYLDDRRDFIKGHSLQKLQSELKRYAEAGADGVDPEIRAAIAGGLEDRERIYGRGR